MDGSEDSFSPSDGSFKDPPENFSTEAGNSEGKIPYRIDAYHASSSDDANFTGSEQGGQSLDDGSPFFQKLQDNEAKDCQEDSDLNAIGSFLPDDEDELLARIMEDFDLSGLPSKLEDLDEYDLFSSGGGMELDLDGQERLTSGMSKVGITENVAANGIGHCGFSNGMGTVAGEHPYGEHPSRTLFVRNINSNVEDSELRALFEPHGDIRTLYTACKHRGFVMISYYDIRAARRAMRALQNKPLRRRKLDIHFSIPKDNPSERDINQGTLVVFNLDPSVSNEDLHQVFGAYGEVKEIRETPHKRHHKFIEFYDVRDAEAALKSLNRSDIAGKRIKLEPSRPGGARRSLMLQLNQELEHDDARSFWHSVGSPIANSPPGNWARFGSPVEQNPFQPFGLSPTSGAQSPIKSSSFPGLSSILPPHASNTVKIAPIGKGQGRSNHFNQLIGNTWSTQVPPIQQSHSLPDQKLSSSPGPMSSSGESNSNSSGFETLSGPQFLWGRPTPYAEHNNSSAWSTSSVTHPYKTSGPGHGSPYSNRLGSFSDIHHHHMGSAPPGVHLDRSYGYFGESPDTSYTNQAAFGGACSSHNSGSYLMNMGSHSSAGLSIPSSMVETGSPNFKMVSMPRHGPFYFGNGNYAGPIEGFLERGRGRRLDNSGSQMDSKKQYQLDLDKIASGEDTRTTLMIKNIPNKYTSQMLLAAIDENHRGTCDFLYLPIDFKNKCNVGYAFINMVSPSHIASFYQAFNGKKWEKFNSEKVASLAYARIQGKAALITHFQNSGLMNEDKRCRPILFQSEGLENDQEIFVSSNFNVCIRQPDGSYSSDLLDCPKGTIDEKSDKN
ncbi:RNA recognition motif domain [Dillenia turbinata]|uniref:RNA recognition motif domain n=1 Tax=Dillenia turbinata TaxID=194707 RepID=A0AAN8UYV5_9MAGN